MVNFSGLKSQNEAVKLCAEQIQAVDQIEHASKPVTIITGQAGSGKSTIINHLRQMRARYTVCATTGKAALNVGGATVDSVFCIKREDWSIWSPERQMRIMRDIPDRIIIDEASMIGHAMGDLIANAAKEYSKKIILVGDWAQARPVKDDWILGSTLMADYQYIKLMENHRQDGDKQYMEILNKLRLGEVDAEVTRVMRDRIVAQPDDQADLRLYATNSMVETYNKYRLFDHCVKAKTEYFTIRTEFRDERKAATQARNHRDQRFIDQQIEHSRLGHDIPLALGSRALVTLNQAEIGVVNGDTGTVVRVDDPFGQDLTSSLGDHPGDHRDVHVGRIHLQLDRGGVAVISKCTVDAKDPTGDGPLHSLRGFPLALGYACTIHKSQGMTVNRAWVDMNSLMKFPDPESRHGLAYVALSRTRTLQGLTVGQWIPGAVYCDPVIKPLI